MDLAHPPRPPVTRLDIGQGNEDSGFLSYCVIVDACIGSTCGYFAAVAPPTTPQPPRRAPAPSGHPASRAQVGVNAPPGKRRLPQKLAPVPASFRPPSFEPRSTWRSVISCASVAAAGDLLHDGCGLSPEAAGFLQIFPSARGKNLVAPALLPFGAVAIRLQVAAGCLPGQIPDRRHGRVLPVAAAQASSKQACSVSRSSSFEAPVSGSRSNDKHRVCGPPYLPVNIAN